MKQNLCSHSPDILHAFEAPTEYKIPFEFVVPAELPHHICHHRRQHEQVYWEHTQLPPSIGTPTDLDSGKFKNWNELAPAILSITYRIHVRIRSDKSPKDGDPSTIGEWSYPVRIHPQRKERPPIWIPDGSKFYCMRQDRQITKGFSRCPVGLLSAWAEQPPAVRVQPTPNSSIQINLQYTATRQYPLPGISGLDLKLQAFTAYGAETWPDFPDLTDTSSWISSQDYYTDNVPLLRSPGHPLVWREDPLCATNTNDHVTHTAILKLPIALPRNMSLPPSFYSCLVSRTYSLKLSMHLRPAGQWTNTKISLIVPVQIC